MIAARQELDLRPQLERLDRLICWSEGIDEGALGFTFRPLWQLEEPAKAALALSRAQATQVYAGLKLWPDAVVAKLAEAQLVADGTYPNAATVFAEQGGAAAAVDAAPTLDFDPTQPRDPDGRWTFGTGNPSATASPALSSETTATANSLTVRSPDDTPVLSASTGLSGAEKGSHAPDGTPITLAASADDPQGLKIAKAAATAAGLNRAQRRISHDAITGQGITDYQKLLSIALGVKKGDYP